MWRQLPSLKPHQRPRRLSDFHEIRGRSILKFLSSKREFRKNWRNESCTSDVRSGMKIFLPVISTSLDRSS